MAKFSTLQNNFLAGELSPRLMSRSDIDEYKNGCAKLINFIPRPSGGVSFRPGLRYQKTVTLNASPDRFTAIEFFDNTDTSYLIILDPEHATAASRVQIIRNDGTTIAMTGTFGSPYTSLALALAELPIDYYGFRYAQKGNLLFITHVSGRMPPLILFKSNTNFYLADWLTAINLIPGTIPNYLKTPYFGENGSITLTPSAVTGAITLTASSAYFTSTMVGARIRIRESNVEGIAVITGFTSSTQVSATTEVNFNSGAARNTWRISAWNTFHGWPKYVTLFEQRIVFASNVENPDEIWFSAIGNIFLLMQDKLAQDASTDVSGSNYYGPKDATDPFSVFPSSTGTVDIRWITSSKTLHVGTGKEEFSIEGSQGKFAFNSITIKSQTGVGGSNCNAVRVMNSTFYVTGDGKRIREFAYSDENGSYLSKDISVLNEDILDHAFDSTDSNTAFSDIRFLALSWNPSKSVLFAIIGGTTLTSKSKLVGFAYDKGVNLRGWFRVETTADIYAVCNVVNTLGTHIYSWFATKRTLNGSDVYLLEKMGPIPFTKTLFRAGDFDEDKPHYLDCARRSTLASTVSHTGFTHLANETVSIIVEGQYLGEKVVSAGGVITLDTAATEVIAGFKYTGTIKLMNIEEGSRIGNPDVLFKRIDRVILNLFRSLGGMFGNSDTNLNPVEYPDFSDDTYTGKSNALDFDSTPGEDQSVTIIQDEPKPFNLMSISMRGLTEDL